MKKKLEMKLIDVKTEIRALKDEYPETYPIEVDYKIAAAKLELLVEFIQMFPKK